MTTVNVQEAKTRLSDLLARVERGEEVVVARAGRPVARLVPVEKPSRRTFGTVPMTVPTDFDEALPEEELSAWE